MLTAGRGYEFLAGAGSDAAGPRSCLTRPSGTHRGGLKVPAGGGILLPQEEPSLVQVRLARGIFRLRSERRTLAVGLPWLNVVLLDVRPSSLRDHDAWMRYSRNFTRVQEETEAFNRAALAALQHTTPRRFGRWLGAAPGRLRRRPSDTFPTAV